MRGSKTGVYIGCSMSEAVQAFCNDPEPKDGYGVTGTNRTMLANRLSFYFDLHGKGTSYNSKLIMIYPFPCYYIMVNLTAN